MWYTSCEQPENMRKIVSRKIYCTKLLHLPSYMVCLLSWTVHSLVTHWSDFSLLPLFAALRYFFFAHSKSNIYEPLASINIAVLLWSSILLFFSSISEYVVFARQKSAIQTIESMSSMLPMNCNRRLSYTWKSLNSVTGTNIFIPPHYFSVHV